jgi:predicted amidohydrolase
VTVPGASPPSDGCAASPRTLRVGACQTPEILGDPDTALDLIAGFARHDVDLLVFPECFLQGYLVTPEHVGTWAIDVDSDNFSAILDRLAPIRQTLVFGFIERRGSRFFNTAAVVSSGRLLGAYRKVHLVPGESIFTPGGHYPVFEVRGVRFGINICFDARFPRAAAAVAAQGADLLVIPAQNMMRRVNAYRWHGRNIRIGAERVRETGMWLALADVTGERGEHRIGLGPTCVLNPGGQVVTQVAEGTTGIAVAEIVRI